MLLDPISRRLLKEAGLVPAVAGRGPVVLMYHGIHHKNDDDGWPWSILADRFLDHLQVLKEWGWQTLRPCDLSFDDKESVRKVAITFDDGYRNNLDLAIPFLQEFGMAAAWFVVTQGLGGQAPWKDTAAQRRELLSPADIRQMLNMGFEIGSHGRHHRDLTKHPKNELMDELLGSRQDLEDLLGHEVTSFAYPFGAFNDQSVDAVAKAGYCRAFTSNAGWLGSEPHPLRVRRVAILREDTASRFARKLAFADTRIGWNRMSWYLLKRLASRLRRRTTVM